MDKETIIRIRLFRHCLVPQLTGKSEYLHLFRELQPISTSYVTHPGAPPSLVPRAAFDDRELTERLRGSGQIVKGRFLGDGIGYVFRKDLEIYANAFRKPLTRFNEKQLLIMDALQACGPLTARQIKEETGLLNKEIMPALHRMQRAFLVFEDQSDSDMERSWFLFEEEWPDINLSDGRRLDALTEVLLRFLKCNVFATLEQMKDWSRLPMSALKAVAKKMKQDGLIDDAIVAGLGSGSILLEDQPEADVSERTSVFMFCRTDPLARAHVTELKRLFGNRDILQYLLIDGEFKGAVLGHWRIGPHDVEDVTVLLRPEECMNRREEIVSVIAGSYAPPRSRILRYCGEKLTQP